MNNYIKYFIYGTFPTEEFILLNYKEEQEKGKGGKGGSVILLV